MQAGSCEAPPGPHQWALRVSIISAHLGTCWFLCACGGWTLPQKCPRAFQAFKDSFHRHARHPSCPSRALCRPPPEPLCSLLLPCVFLVGHFSPVVCFGRPGSSRASSVGTAQPPVLTPRWVVLTTAQVRRQEEVGPSPGHLLVRVSAGLPELSSGMSHVPDGSVADPGLLPSALPPLPVPCPPLAGGGGGLPSPPAHSCEAPWVPCSLGLHGPQLQPGASSRNWPLGFPPWPPPRLLPPVQTCCQ